MLFRPVFVYFLNFLELVPEVGGFEVIAGGGQHAKDIAEPPLVANVPLGDHFSRLRDGPACLQGLDNEVAEGDNRSKSKKQQYTEKQVAYGKQKGLLFYIVHL